MDDGSWGQNVGDPGRLVILRVCRWNEELRVSVLPGLLMDTWLGMTFDWGFMRLGFTIHNVGEMDVPYLVAKYDRHVDLS